MSFWDLFKKKPTHRSEQSYELTEEDRETASAMRKASATLKKRKFELDMANLELEHKKREIELNIAIEKKNQELQDLQDDEEDYDDEEDNSGSTADKMLMAFLMKLNPAQSRIPTFNEAVATSPEVASASLVNYSDQQLQEIHDKIPRGHRKIMEKLTDDQLRAMIKANLPSINDDSVERAVLVARGR